MYINDRRKSTRCKSCLKIITVVRKYYAFSTNYTINYCNDMRILSTSSWERFHVLWFIDFLWTEQHFSSFLYSISCRFSTFSHPYEIMLFVIHPHHLTFQDGCKKIAICDSSDNEIKNSQDIHHISPRKYVVHIFHIIQKP